MTVGMQRCRVERPLIQNNQCRRTCRTHHETAQSRNRRPDGVEPVFVGWLFLLIPLVAVHYVDDLGWAAGTIGIMLAIRQFSQQGLSMFFGMLCDRVGPKPLICSGQLVRAVGFGGMAFADTPATVLIAMALAGFGGALFDAPKVSGDSLSHNSRRTTAPLRDTWRHQRARRDARQPAWRPAHQAGLRDGCPRQRSRLCLPVFLEPG